MQSTIIIPTKNRESILFNSLNHNFDAFNSVDGEVIIINDGDNDIIIPDEWKFKIKIIKNLNNGVASSRNLGVKNACSDVIIFLDDDMLISEQSLKKIISLLKQHPDCTINVNWIYPIELLSKIRKTKFGRYLDNYGFTSLKGWNTDQPWNDDELFENNGVTSQFLAIHKKTFSLVGGYDESFPHAGYEDYDFAKRLKKCGIKFLVWPKDIVYHNETDRHLLYNWLERKRRGGETRKHAVIQGNIELELHFNIIKRIIFRIIIFSKKYCVRILNILPNLKILDGFYGKVVNILLATSIFEGYTKIKEH